MKFKESMLAVIVLYKTRLSDSKTFISLTESLKVNDMVIDLVVYDNSPEYNLGLPVDYPNWNITYIPDANNSGVSKAYNTGAEIAIKLKKKWIILFDQDTMFPPRTIDTYMATIESNPQIKLFAPIMLSKSIIVSPCIFKLMRGSSPTHIESGINNLDKLSVINCGLCIDVNAFKENNGYNESIKLDFSDHDFMRRFKRNVTGDFVVLDLKVDHELSSEAKNSFNSDKVRFDYYLSGGYLTSNSKFETLLFTFNASVRMLKLTIVHKTLYFMSRLLGIN